MQIQFATELQQAENFLQPFCNKREFVGTEDFLQQKPFQTILQRIYFASEQNLQR